MARQKKVGISEEDFADMIGVIETAHQSTVDAGLVEQLYGEYKHRDPELIAAAFVALSRSGTPAKFLKFHDFRGAVANTILEKNKVSAETKRTQNAEARANAVTLDGMYSIAKKAFDEAKDPTSKILYSGIMKDLKTRRGKTHEDDD